MSAVEFTGWAELSQIPVLESGEIHVWRISLAGQSGEEILLKDLLSSPEHEQAARFHFAHDQRRFIIRRAVLRQLLAACMGTIPLNVRFELGSRGKPVVAGESGVGGLRFNCSHSADWALIALARGIELGVDLEQHRPLTEAEDIAKNYFSAVEISELAGLPPALKTAGFYNGWSRKEAFIKAVGRGLSYPLNRFTVSLSPDKPAALLAVADDHAALKKWSMVSLEVIPDFSAALVFEGKASALKFFTWKSRPPTAASCSLV